MTQTGTPSPSIAPGTTIALVTDSTPSYLEYGDYRGWVALDTDGTYSHDVTEVDVVTADVAWETTDDDYARLGTVLS